MQRLICHLGALCCVLFMNEYQQTFSIAEKAAKSGLKYSPPSQTFPYSLLGGHGKSLQPCPELVGLWPMLPGISDPSNCSQRACWAQLRGVATDYLVLEYDCCTLSNIKCIEYWEEDTSHSNWTTVDTWFVQYREKKRLRINLIAKKGK